MQLLTKELEAQFAEVGSQEEVDDPIVIAKFFNPAGGGRWYATEYDPETKIFFGYVSIVTLSVPIAPLRQRNAATPVSSTWMFLANVAV